jgi:hypothetical protein
MPKEAIVVDFEALSKHVLGRLKKSTTNLRMVGIRTGYIPNKSQMRYRLSQLARKWKFL